VGRENALGRHADGEDCRLRVFSEFQVGVGSFKAETRKRKSARLVGLGKRIGGNSKTFSEFTAHANRLRALSGKKESDLCIHSKRIVADESGLAGVRKSRI
jgi:hypothetical protein